jgi:Ca-activated chloride channel family protein
LARRASRLAARLALAHVASLPPANLPGTANGRAREERNMTSNTHETPDSGPGSQLPQMLIASRRPALLAGHANTLDVLVRVQAPAAAPAAAPRHPLHLALVIDRSGSMSGHPLAEARRCAEFVLDGLEPDDRLALVVYDDQVQTLVPATRVGDAREVLRRAVHAIDSGGSTNLHGGWRRGVECLLPHVTPQAVSRVILLSDGCANAGLCEPQAIFAQCAEFASAGIGTSTYGLGHGFNEDLMIGMGRAGQGTAYYGQTADDLMDPFREEFDLLNALCARALRLEVVTPPGVKVKLLNAYPAAGDGAWALPDLAYGGEAWAVLRLKVPAPALPAAGSAAQDLRQLLTLALRYTGLDGEPRAIQPQSLALPVLPASAFHAIAEDELVVRRVGELEAAELQQRARLSAMRGDWSAVMALLQRAERLGAENPWIAAALVELRQLAERRDDVMFAKESAFSSVRMQGRLAAVSETRDGLDAAPASYLRRKSAQGKGEPPAARGTRPEGR